MPTRDEKNNFSIMIEDLANRLKISHIEAVTHYCEEKNLEVEVAALLVNDSLRSKIEADAQFLRYLPRTSQLPL